MVKGYERTEGRKEWRRATVRSVEGEKGAKETREHPGVSGAVEAVHSPGLLLTSPLEGSCGSLQCYR